MKKAFFALLAVSSLAATQAIEMELDLSPPGTDAAVGLNAQNEVPPVDSLASGGELGSGLRYDTDSNILTVRVGYGSVVGFTDLEGDFTATHFHAGQPGESGPVIINLSDIHIPLGTRSGLLSGQVTLTEDQEADLFAGNIYLNIHSTEAPSGEIRGQVIVIPEPHTWALLLGGLGALAFYRRRISSR